MGGPKAWTSPIGLDGKRSDVCSQGVDKPTLFGDDQIPTFEGRAWVSYIS